MNNKKEYVNFLKEELGVISEDKDGKIAFSIIPSEIKYDNSLCANAKLLYGEIYSLCGKRGYCWATNKYFSKLYGVSTRIITKWISQLQEKNHITTDIVTTISGNRRHIKLTRNYLKEFLKKNNNME